MSVQAGIYYFEKKSVSDGEVSFLIEGLANRAPDYSDIRMCGPVGMGFRGFLITPQDRNNQPYCAAADRLMITFDGRLDQRGDLARELGKTEWSTESDVEIVACAYDLFGEHCFEKLKGEYALVLWDRKKQSLFLARSCCGTCPLFYNLSKDRIVWSSELDDLVVKSDVDPVVNRAYAIGYAYYQPDPDECPYRDVSLVPPGTYVEVVPSGKASKAREMWFPERLSTLRLSTDDEYEEALRQHLTIAIGDKLRVRGPVFSELSGGLDSSTVVMIADHVLRSTGRDPDSLTTVSCVYETSTDCDESRFIAIVEKARGCQSIHVSESSQQLTLGLEDVAFSGSPSPIRLVPGRYGTIGRHMRASGSRVLFTGLGGDELFWSDNTGSPALADLAVSWHWLTAISQAKEWGQASGTPVWRVLLDHAVAPVTGVARFARWQPSEITNLCSWTTPEARQWLNQRGRRLGLRIDTRVSLPSRRSRLLSVRSFLALIAAGYFREWSGIHISHPFAHQGLIDFMLSLPMDQIARPGATRSLMRRATRGILPEKTRIRKSKATTDESFCRLLARDHESIGEASKLLVCENGFAESAALSQAILEVSIGRMQQSASLFRLLSLEQWLRSLRWIERQRSLLRQSPKSVRALSVAAS